MSASEKDSCGRTPTFRPSRLPFSTIKRHRSPSSGSDRTSSIRSRSSSTMPTHISILRKERWATGGWCRVWEFSIFRRDFFIASCRPIKPSSSHTTASSASAFGGVASGRKCSSTIVCRQSTGNWRSFRRSTRTRFGRVCSRRLMRSEFFQHCQQNLIVGKFRFF